jgi:ribosome biogenesis protein Tsr3
MLQLIKIQLHLHHCCNKKATSKTLNRVDTINLIHKTMVNLEKQALILAIVAERNDVSTVHCSNCGHCVATL